MHVCRAQHAYYMICIHISYIDKNKSPHNSSSAGTRILEHPGRGRSLGAVYIDPPPAALAQDRSSGVDGGGNVAGGEIVHLSYWMAAELSVEGGKDEALLRKVLRWLTTAWPFQRVMLPVLDSNARQRALCKDALALVPAPAVDGVPAFAFEKNGDGDGKDEL